MRGLTLWKYEKILDALKAGLAKGNFLAAAIHVSREVISTVQELCQRIYVEDFIGHMNK